MDAVHVVLVVVRDVVAVTFAVSLVVALSLW